MTVELDKDVEEFLHEQTRQGGDTARELVNDLLRTVRDQAHGGFRPTKELEAWLLEAADEETSPLVSADFQAIWRKIRDK